MSGWSMRTRRVVLCAVAALAPAAAEAEPLTLEAALARARAVAPEVRAATRALAEAQASRVGQGIILPTNPRLFGDYRPMAFELAGQPTEPRNGYAVGLDGLVEVSGAGGARVDEAEQRARVAEAELAAARAAAAARAYAAYVEVQVADRRFDVVDRALELQQRVLDASRERVSAGVAGEPDVTTVSVELASIRAQRLDAERLSALARLSLRAVLDLAVDAPLDLASVELEPGEVEDEATLARRGLERRPELSALRARVELLDRTDDRLAREAFPKLGYNVGLDAAPASPVFAFFGLSVELPFAQRNQGPRAVAAAQRVSEVERVELELRKVAREVSAAYAGYTTRRAQLRVLTDDALPAARRTEDLVEEGWRAGRFDVFRLITATRELLRVERDRLETLQAAWSDYVELQRASGGLNP
jgi:cobalt-zinc-cadmium efflux system outer membrane protein